MRKLNWILLTLLLVSTSWSEEVPGPSAPPITPIEIPEGPINYQQYLGQLNERERFLALPDPGEEYAGCAPGAPAGSTCSDSQREHYDALVRCMNDLRTKIDQLYRQANEGPIPAVNADGHPVDADGRRVDSEGYVLNRYGQRLSPPERSQQATVSNALDTVVRMQADIAVLKLARVFTRLQNLDVGTNQTREGVIVTHVKARTYTGTGEHGQQIYTDVLQGGNSSSTADKTARKQQIAESLSQFYEYVFNTNAPTEDQRYDTRRRRELLRSIQLYSFGAEANNSRLTNGGIGSQRREGSESTKYNAGWYELHDRDIYILENLANFYPPGTRPQSLFDSAMSTLRDQFSGAAETGQSDLNAILRQGAGLREEHRGDPSENYHAAVRSFTQYIKDQLKDWLQNQQNEHDCDEFVNSDGTINNSITGQMGCIGRFYRDIAREGVFNPNSLTDSINPILSYINPTGGDTPLSANLGQFEPGLHARRMYHDFTGCRMRKNEDGDWEVCLNLYVEHLHGQDESNSVWFINASGDIDERTTPDTGSTFNQCAGRPSGTLYSAQTEEQLINADWCIDRPLHFDTNRYRRGGADNHDQMFKCAGTAAGSEDNDQPFRGASSSSSPMVVNLGDSFRPYVTVYGTRERNNIQGDTIRRDTNGSGVPDWRASSGSKDEVSPSAPRGGQVLPGMEDMPEDQRTMQDDTLMTRRIYLDGTDPNYPGVGACVGWQRYRTDMLEGGDDGKPDAPRNIEIHSQRRTETRFYAKARLYEPREGDQIERGTFRWKCVSDAQCGADGTAVPEQRTSRNPDVASLIDEAEFPRKTYAYDVEVTYYSTIQAVTPAKRTITIPPLRIIRVMAAPGGSNGANQEVQARVVMLRPGCEEVPENQWASHNPPCVLIDSTLRNDSTQCPPDQPHLWEANNCIEENTACIPNSDPSSPHETCLSGRRTGTNPDGSQVHIPTELEAELFTIRQGTLTWSGCTGTCPDGLTAGTGNSINSSFPFPTQGAEAYAPTLTWSNNPSGRTPPDYEERSTTVTIDSSGYQVTVDPMDPTPISVDCRPTLSHRTHPEWIPERQAELNLKLFWTCDRIVGECRPEPPPGASMAGNAWGAAEHGVTQTFERDDTNDYNVVAVLVDPTTNERVRSRACNVRKKSHSFVQLNLVPNTTWNNENPFQFKVKPVLTLPAGVSGLRRIPSSLSEYRCRNEASRSLVHPCPHETAIEFTSTGTDTWEGPEIVMDRPASGQYELRAVYEYDEAIAGTGASPAQDDVDVTSPNTGFELRCPRVEQGQAGYDAQRESWNISLSATGSVPDYTYTWTPPEGVECTLSESLNNLSNISCPRHEGDEVKEAGLNLRFDGLPADDPRNKRCTMRIRGTGTPEFATNVQEDRDRRTDENVVVKGRVTSSPANQRFPAGASLWWVCNGEHKPADCNAPQADPVTGTEYQKTFTRQEGGNYTVTLVGKEGTEFSTQTFAEGNTVTIPAKEREITWSISVSENENDEEDAKAKFTAEVLRSNETGDVSNEGRFTWTCESEDDTRRNIPERTQEFDRKSDDYECEVTWKKDGSDAVVGPESFTVPKEECKKDDDGNCLQPTPAPLPPLPVAPPKPPAGRFELIRLQPKGFQRIRGFD